ncbi:MAG TPA: hypothetical protein VFY93_09950 [Planctomycetota bacterium]|nr:hypothetical protein [Planctomycetota bacterium]
MVEPSERLPPRTLPVAYVAAAHVSLLAAFLAIALEPSRFMGFYYHPKMLGVVHLVTLGWITGTTLGLSYVAGPLALRTTVRSGWVDGAACALFLVGASGVATHFWLDEYAAVAWAGVLVLPALVVVAVRMAKGLRTGGAPLPVRLHVACAYGNLLLAALLAIHLALRKSGEAHAVPLHHVQAHAHLAAVGWATLMVMGVGYRLLAMLFPAAPPGDRTAWTTLLLFEAGILGLAGALFWKGPLWPFALLVAAALAVFLGAVVRMRFRLMPAPKKLRRPDYGVLHVGFALVCLAAATGFGLFLALTPDPKPDAVKIYGVLGLLGFLSQMIVGVEMRLLPMFAFTEAFARGGHKALPPSPHDMPWRKLQAVSLVAWLMGVPLLTWGFLGEVGDASGEGGVEGAAWILAAGTVAAALSSARVLRLAYRAPSRR